MVVFPEREEQFGVSPEVQEVGDRFSPEAEKRLQEIGAQIRPNSPKQVEDGLGRPITRSVGHDNLGVGVSIKVPVGGAQATTWSHGSPSDSRTWLGVAILRKIKMALHHGWKIVVGKA